MRPVVLLSTSSVSETEARSVKDPLRELNKIKIISQIKPNQNQKQNQQNQQNENENENQN